MYSLSDYGRMIADRVRMDPYAFALKEVVGPNSVVLDIGAGAGVHAFLAAKFGARKVYAIEPNEIIHLAQELAEANGFADRIAFIHDLSTNVTLLEQADVIVSDLRGVLPLFGRHIPAIVDARQRHLAPGGVMIPRCDSLWVALVEAPVAYREMTTAWDRPYGFDMTVARSMVLNSWTQDDTDMLCTRHLLTEPANWATLDYQTRENPDVGPVELNLTTTREGTVHGLFAWFDSELAEGIGFANGPDVKRPAEVYGRAFFPLLEPVAVGEGDTTRLELQATLEGDHYEWRWRTEIRAGGKKGEVKAAFEQSTSWAGSQYARRISREMAAGQPPVLGDEGQVARFVIKAINGRTAFEDIVDQALGHFPTRFGRRQDAVIYVYELLQEYRY